MTDSRLSRILEARGVKGVLLLPLPPGRTDIRLRWPMFTGISTCHLSTPIGLNQVVANRQEYVELALEKLKSLRFRRIGLAIDEDMDIRSGHQTIEAIGRAAVAMLVGRLRICLPLTVKRPLLLVPS